MPVIIFKLKNVPDDEADDIRELLCQHNIDFYETAAGNWGISMPAIWIKHNQYKEQARELIENYQAQRTEQARALYNQRKYYGTQKTLKDTFLRNPLRLLIYFFAIALILYLSLTWIFDLMKR